jgi:tetratricopeptide (TPR) repeat protein
VGAAAIISAPSSENSLGLLSLIAAGANHMLAASLLAKQTRVPFCIFIASQLAIGTVAVAQQQPNWDWCTGRNNPTFEQRIDACTAIIELDSVSLPDKAKAFGSRGVAYANHNNADAAVRDYEDSLRLDDTSGSSHRFRGNKYLIEKNIEGALTEYNEAVRLDPTDVLALTNRGSMYVIGKDYNHAIADFNEAIRLDPNLSLAYYARGRMYYAEKEYDRALADLDNAIRLNSRSAHPFIFRGLVHRAKGNVSQAITDYDQAIQLDPKEATAYLNRGSAYSYKGNHSQAIADYDRAIQINPVDAVAYGSRCGNRIAAGQDLHAALSDCNESLRLEPRQIWASTHRGFIHLRLGDVNRAIADFDAALSIDAKYVLALYGRGLARWDNGDTSGGQADVTAAKKASPKITRAVAKYYGSVPQRNLLLRLADALAKEHPMAFTIARGSSSDSCGVGCNEWIVADGIFDKDVDKRFRKFLDGLRGRKLPIFFNSGGGFLNGALAIGRMLRERKMTAGVGMTIPEDCRGDKVVDESCRHMLRAIGPLQKLRTAGATCNSACVYAFIGASIRQIPQGAILSVHSPLLSDSEVQSSRAMRREYAKKMGVDPEFVELADKTLYIDIHVLTRDEIARLQIETIRH